MSYQIQRPNYAFVKSSTSDFYYKDSNGDPLLVNIDKAIRIARDNPKEHKKRHYMSLHPNINRRYRLKVHTVNNQYERYTKASDGKEFDQAYDESMSHKCAVETISKMKSMTFSLTNKDFQEVTFDFDSVLKEPFVRLPNGAEYYPDILCTFDEDHEMYDKWGGKLAIEVTYAHECEDFKLEDYLFHNIPVIEVRIDNGSSRQFPAEKPGWPRWQEWDESTVDEHMSKLQEWFQEKIYAELIVDPVSTRVHLQEKEKYDTEIQRLEDRESALLDKIEDNESTHQSLASHLRRFKQLAENTELEKQHLSTEFRLKTEELNRRLEVLRGDNNTALQSNRAYEKVLWSGLGLLLFFILFPAISPGLFEDFVVWWFNSILGLKAMLF